MAAPGLIGAWCEQNHMSILVQQKDWIAIRRFDIVDGEPKPFNRLAPHDLANAATPGQPERRQARKTAWRQRLAAEPWFNGRDTIDTRRGNKPRAKRQKGGRKMDLRVAPVSVQSQVVAKLREAIFAGAFNPGEKLSEPALCRDLGVSRTSIREALRSLAAEKLVTIVPNRGPSVTKITWEEADAIYQVRALLEGEAVALLARRIQEPELRAMSAALAAFEAAAWKDDAMEGVASAARFYEIILTRCGNPIVGDLLHLLHARINFLHAGTMSIPGRSQASLREMRAMLDAVATGNAEQARQAALDHVSAARAAAECVYSSPPS
jgi:DNA-binding GntR family transcriptional regulator